MLNIAALPTQAQLDTVQIEICIEKLEPLFRNGNLCAADIHCLNKASKQKIWQLCLAACAKQVACQLMRAGKSPQSTSRDEKQIESKPLVRTDLVA